MKTLLVLTNLPDVESARRLAQSVVEARVAACVNILAPCESVYRWNGKLEIGQEYPMLIKTSRECYARLEAAIRASHPYELPEIIAVPVTAGSSAYLDWVISETMPLDSGVDSSR